MTEIDGVTFSDLENKWKNFKRNRDYHMSEDHPCYLKMVDREKLIDKMIEHFHFLQEEYFAVVEEGA